MSNKLLLSIIVPTYNRSELLKRSLPSIEAQTLKDFEVIIYNDASSDNTEEVILEFCLKNKNFKYIKGQKNGGVNVARNIAIKQSLGEWVAFLDDDDEFLPHAIETIKKNILEIPQNYNVAYFNSILKRSKGEIYGGFQFERLKNGKNYYDPSYKETITKFNLIGDCKPVFRRSLFKNNTYKFPESVNGFESYTMNLIARDKKGIRYFKDITTLIHQEDELEDRLSINVSRKNLGPLFVLHFKQIIQHFGFYIFNPKILLRKTIEMSKLLARFVIQGL